MTYITSTVRFYLAEFWCPSCRQFIYRRIQGRKQGRKQRVLRERCEKAGRRVRLVRRSGSLPKAVYYPAGV